jgi:hypothetical protein
MKFNDRMFYCPVCGTCTIRDSNEEEIRCRRRNCDGALHLYDPKVHAQPSSRIAG